MHLLQESFWKCFSSQGHAGLTPARELPTVHQAASRRLPQLPRAAAALGELRGAGGRLSCAGSSRSCQGVRGQGRRLQPQAGRGVRNRIQTFALAPSHSAVPSLLSTCGLLLFLMLSAVPFFYFCHLNDFSVTQCASIHKALAMATS